jgi:hypothetical protein
VDKPARKSETGMAAALGENVRMEDVSYEYAMPV